MSDVRPISYEAIAFMVCKRMTDLGWSVKDLAKYCEISPNTLGHIRSGDIGVSFKRFAKILQVLGIYLEYGPAKTAKEAIGRKIGEARVAAERDRRRRQYKATLGDGRQAWVGHGLVVAHLPRKKTEPPAS